MARTKAKVAQRTYGPHLLGRRPKWDWRNLLMRDYITPQRRALAQAVTSKLWNLPTISDQGQTPECVGYCQCNNGNAEPVLDGWPNARGDEIYQEAKRIDGDNEPGTSTLSGVKALLKFTQFKDNNKYAFFTALEDIKTWTLTQAPVPSGIPWTWGMFDTDANGFVYPTDDIAGGHEVLIVGYDRPSDVFTFANSWGNSWGKNGFFYMHANDYQFLMNQEGDAVAFVEVALTPDPTPAPTPNPGCSIVVQKLLGLK